MIKTTYFSAALGLCLALGLAACGGGGDLPPKARIGQVVVMGDSLADVGTFGFKFTVQDAAQPKGTPIWPQLVANVLGVDGNAQCNVFRSSYDAQGEYTEVYTDNPAPGCTNYAVGGARIIVPGLPTSPRNVGKQLEKRAAVGPYAATDLVLIDGGGNDVADLVKAYLSMSSDPALATYKTFLKQQLDDATRDALLGQTQGPALAAGAYMQKLADTFYEQIKAQVLDKGAQRVAVLNVGDITLTPRFKLLLQGVAAKSTPANAAALEGAIRQWIVTFNARLAARIGADARVALVDFFTDLTDQIDSPAEFLLSDVRNAACPSTGVDNGGLPKFNFPTCTAAALDAAPPTGKSAGWWKSYTFSDDFHPTPYGHQLLSASVSRALARAGWL